MSCNRYMILFSFPMQHFQEEEPAAEEEPEEGAKKRDPNSIEEIQALFQTDKGYFVQLTYTQRWRLKINSWKQWKNLYAERDALLEARIKVAVERDGNALGSLSIL
jgi:hypothetical protein